MIVGVFSTLRLLFPLGVGVGGVLGDSVRFLSFSVLVWVVVFVCVFVVVVLVGGNWIRVV